MRSCEIAIALALAACQSSPTRTHSPPERDPMTTAPSAPADVDAVLALVDASQRDAARALLVERVLPPALAAAGGDAAHVRAELIALLDATPAAARLDELRAEALRAEVRELAIAALAVAKARYLADHPDRAARVGEAIDARVQALRALTPAALAAEVEQRTAQLDAWERAAADRPDVARGYRRAALEARGSLDRARTGSFTSAAGALHQFLVSAGEKPTFLDEF